MVRRFDPSVPVEMEVVRDLVALAVRAPSAGFSQGWDFVALLNPQDRAAFW
nr:nitroreductase family protein [Dermatophilaceae bacterium]